MTESSFGGFFDNALKGGGGGAPSFKFHAQGSGVIGTIADIFETFVTVKGTTDAKLDKNGNKIPQLNVTLDTDLRDWKGVINIPTDDDDRPLPATEDDGKRRVFLKYDMARAVGLAVQAAGATFEDFKVGAKLGVKWSDVERLPNGNEMHLYTAVFEKAPDVSPGFFPTDGAQDAQAPAESVPAANEGPNADEPPF